MMTSKFKKQSLLVGSRIRSLRKDRALTQADLAARIGIQQSDLCRMENGEYKVSLETLFKILSIFEMNIADFFHEEISGSVRDQGIEFLRQYQRLSPRAQEEVQDFIQFKLLHEDKPGTSINNKKSN
ncbi:MAG: helix-turn-helix transcriptional regulator [Chloroflexi bacterium]|nr:MAG: helix-turn-helix transcriptional regulator [Chloroflexota bacterium]